MRLWHRSETIVAATTAVICAHEALGWDGFVLPRLRMPGGAVYPVIAWRATAARRKTTGPKPTFCRPTLSEWEVDGPASAVRIVGFLHTGSPCEGISRLKAVAAYGPGALVVADAGRVGCWTMAEADLAGISVIQSKARGVAKIALRGRDMPLPTARRTVATRLREEQLFDWALHVGAEPAGQSCSPVPVDVVN